MRNEDLEAALAIELTHYQSFSLKIAEVGGEPALSVLARMGAWKCLMPPIANQCRGSGGRPTPLRVPALADSRVNPLGDWLPESSALAGVGQQ